MSDWAGMDPTDFITLLVVYAMFFAATLMTYDFLLKDEPVPSPYEFLERRRIATESVDRKVDRFGKKMVFICIALLYLLMPYYAFYRYFLNFTFDMAYLYAEAMKEYGVTLFSITMVFLGIETFITYKSKAELSAAFFETFRLNRVRLWSFICGIFSAVLIMAYVFLTAGYSALYELSDERLVAVICLVTGSLFLLALHLVLLLYATVLQVLCDPRSVKRRIVSKLSFSEICRSCVRDGSAELKREVFGSILEYYDIYSLKVLGRWLYRAESISFMSPVEEVYRHFRDNRNPRTEALSEEEKCWYKKALFKMYRLPALLFGLEIFAVFILKNECHGIWKLVLILPLVVTIVLVVVTARYLQNDKEGNYSRVVSQNAMGWFYIFRYRRKNRGSGETDERKIFSQDDLTYKGSRKKEQSYIRTIMSFMEYIRQVNELEINDAMRGRLYRNLAEHVAHMERLKDYELAQYRSVLILFHYVWRKETQDVCASDGSMSGAAVWEAEKRDFRYCTDHLTYADKMRLHDFLSDITLDYYGAADESGAAGLETRSEANRNFEKYWQEVSW